MPNERKRKDRQKAWGYTLTEVPQREREITPVYIRPLRVETVKCKLTLRVGTPAFNMPEEVVHQVNSKLVERVRQESGQRRETEARKQAAKKKWKRLYPIWEWINFKRERTK